MKTKIFSCRANLYSLKPHFIFMSGIEAQNETVKSQPSEQPEITYKTPQEASDATKKEGKDLSQTAIAHLEDQAKQLGIKDELPVVDILPGSIREDEIKQITKNYPEVIEKKLLENWSTRINIMRENFRNQEGRDMKYGESIVNTFEDSNGESKSKKEFILFCDYKENKPKFRLFKQP